MVVVLDRRVTTVGPVFVLMSLSREVSPSRDPIVHGAVCRSRHEERDGQQDDGAAGGGVGVVGRRHAAHAADHADDHGQADRGPEAAGDELRSGVGHDHQGADQQQPNHAHRDHDRHGGQHGQGDVEGGDPHAGGPRILLVVGNREQARAKCPGDCDHHQRQGGEDQEVALGRRGDCAKEVGVEVRRRAALGSADDHNAQRDAAVEHDGQGNIAAGSAAGAHELNDHCGNNGERHGSEDRRLVREDTDGDAGQRDVAHPVTDEGQPALDEEDPDHRRGETHEEGREERSLHEVVGEDLRHRGIQGGGQAVRLPARSRGGGRRRRRRDGGRRGPRG